MKKQKKVMGRANSRATRSNQLKPVVVTSKLWSFNFDAVIGGMSYDGEGLHLTKSWPGGEVEYELVPWQGVVIEKASPVSCGWFRWVDDIVVDARSPKLTPKQRKKMDAMVKAVFALPEEFQMRVTLFTGRVSDVCGKERAVRAGAYGFAKKVGNLRKLNRKGFEQLLQTTSTGNIVS